VSEQEQIPPEVRAALGKWFAQVRLARATELAQSKRFREAEAVLTFNAALPFDSRELDLLARIAANQQRFTEARRLWEAALQRELHNPLYQRCLKRLSEVEEQTVFADIVLACLAWALVVALVALVFAFTR